MSCGQQSRAHGNYDHEACRGVRLLYLSSGIGTRETMTIPNWNRAYKHLNSALSNLPPHPQTRTSLVSYAQLGTRSPPESRDIVLYLAGVNEHAALRIVGNKRWRVSHLLWTIQFFSTMEFTS